MKRIEIARRLRREMTDAEALLWSRLRNRQVGGVKFRRQMPIGKFIADFASEEARLVVEIDGGQHSDEVDRAHTEAMEAEGYVVVRFWNDDVLRDVDVVLEEIRRAAGKWTEAQR